MLNSNKFFKFSFISLLVFAIFYKILIKPNFNQEEKKAVNKTFKGIAKVIDGDSIIVDNAEIRIKAIDAPEYHQKCDNNQKKEYHCGKESKEFLENLLKDKTTICKSHKKDIYDRYLSICYVDGIDIAEIMLRNGWAVIYRQPSIFFDIQEDAKNRNAGIWQGNFIYPQTWRKLNRNN
ncbi:thermonuclease family protein [Rickettsiales bacterium]|nr:thermonuclease family protein [Rickettsiales bacterium]